MRLDELGWDEAVARDFAAWADKTDLQPARVAIEFNHIFRVYVEEGELEAVTSGRLKHHATSRGDLPAVGDWVVVRKHPDEDRATIVAVLPRRSRFSRKMAGAVTDEQVVAANVDVIFIVMGLDVDFSLRRLERYLLLARESGAAPVVLLTKPDVSDDVPACVADTVAVTGDLPVHVVSPKLNEGMEHVRKYLIAGRTCALLGSSGVGKSTIINRLVGAEVRKTREVREADSRGRHATSHRELVALPGGGLMIDTPGMRELQLWDVGDAVKGTFDDVEAFARHCHFTDCRHRDEPRCAVKTATANGELAAERLTSYLKLQDELAFLTRQQDERAQLEEKRRAKVMGKALKQHLKSKRFLLLLTLFVLALASTPRAQTRESFFISSLPPAEIQNKQAVVETTHGTIVLDLLAGAAPNHVAHFITRTREGAYDGTIFHRVIAMGIIQGGDPISKDPAQAAKYGTGGLNELRFEPNPEKHTRGAVSAVLVPGRRDSAGSQFFISVTDQPALDGQYTVFARVAEGINVAQKISTLPANATVPNERVEIKKITIRDKPAPAPEPFVSESVAELAQRRAIIETSYGQITIELFPDRAPNHVRQFLRLAASGVYDGTAFHRIVRGFVIQGGYMPTRREPPDERQRTYIRALQPEFNQTPHDRGILSMARGDDPASATSSFFIVLARTPSLDGQYTVFGRVVAGLDVVEKIEGLPVSGETPTERVEVVRVRVSP